MTESDFPNMFDDMTIFDEIDKQKLSKKQKKKLKKKKNKNNKTLGEEGKASADMEVIPLKEEKNSETSEDSVQKKPTEKKEVKSTPLKGNENEKKEESGQKQDSGRKSEKSQERSKKQDVVEKKTEEEKVADSGKAKEIVEKTPEKPLEKVPEKKQDKPQENIEKAPAVIEKTQQKPQEKLPEKPQPKADEKIIKQTPKDNKPQEKQIPPQEKQNQSPENNDDEFIEVTKKRPTLNREANKRFAPLGVRADPPKNTPNKGPIPPLVKTESFEDRFKVEKDCRKKTIEVKTVSNNKPQPTSTPAKPVMSVNAPALSHKPINTTEIEPEPDHLSRTISTEKDSETPAKITHGATLCKKKNANEVLKAKIKRKEIEKQGKTGTPYENYKTNSKEKPIEILRNESYEKKVVNDSNVKKEYKGLSEKIFWWKMENDLNKFTDGIAAECKRMKVFRMCVFDRIEFIVSNLFEKFGAHIKMYGSCVTGYFFPLF